LTANTKTGIAFKVRTAEDLPGVEHILRSPRSITYKHYPRHISDVGSNEPPFINEEQEVVTDMMSVRIMHSQLCEQETVI